MCGLRKIDPGGDVSPPRGRQYIRGRRRRKDGAPLPALQSGEGLQVLGRHLAAAPIGDQLEFDLLALAEIRETGALDGADMDEGIGTAVVGLDEAEAFGRLNHFTVPMLMGVVPSQITQCQSPLARTG